MFPKTTIPTASITIHKLLSFCHFQINKPQIQHDEPIIPATLLLPNPLYPLLMLAFKDYPPQSTFGLLLPADFNHLSHNPSSTPLFPAFSQLLESLETNTPLSNATQHSLLHLFNITGVPCFDRRTQKWEAYPLPFPYIPIETYSLSSTNDGGWFSSLFSYFSSPQPFPLVTISTSAIPSPPTTFPVPIATLLFDPATSPISTAGNSCITSSNTSHTPLPAPTSPQPTPPAHLHFTTQHYLHIPTTSIEYNNFHNMTSVLSHLLGKTALSNSSKLSVQWIDDLIAIFPFVNQIVHNFHILSQKYFQSTEPNGTNTTTALAQDNDLPTTRTNLNNQLRNPASPTPSQHHNPQPIELSSSTIEIKHFFSVFFLNSQTPLTFANFFNMILFFAKLLFLPPPPSPSTQAPIQSFITALQHELLTDLASFLFSTPSVANFLTNPTLLSIAQRDRIAWSAATGKRDEDSDPFESWLVKSIFNHLLVAPSSPLLPQSTSQINHGTRDSTESVQSLIHRVPTTVLLLTSLLQQMYHEGLSSSITPPSSEHKQIAPQSIASSLALSHDSPLTPLEQMLSHSLLLLYFRISPLFPDVLGRSYDFPKLLSL